MFKTIIFLEPEIKEKVEVIAEAISQKDETFSYRIEGEYLVILSQDRNTAVKRGDWFHHKVDVGKKLYFEVESD